MRNARGFTLVELMIVVAVIAILAALAVPAYQDYVARAQVAEGFSLSSGARMAVTVYHAENPGYPMDNAGAGLAQPQSIKGRYVKSVELQQNGRIEVEFGNQASSRIQGQKLILTMTDEGGSLHWHCAGLSRKHLGAACD